MLQKIRKKTDGFTIIEVLIVLAIAGLIMLIVFLAVPALQRNSRNNARNNDASRVAATVQECLNNRNGSTVACDQAEIQATAGTLSQLTGPITVATGAQYSQIAARVWYGSVCDAAGSAASASAGRNFTVTYQLEPNINRCISS